MCLVQTRDDYRRIEQRNKKQASALKKNVCIIGGTVVAVVVFMIIIIQASGTHQEATTSNATQTGIAHSFAGAPLIWQVMERVMMHVLTVVDWE